MRISDWSSDVCSSDLSRERLSDVGAQLHREAARDCETKRTWHQRTRRRSQACRACARQGEVSSGFATNRQPGRKMMDPFYGAIMKTPVLAATAATAVAAPLALLAWKYYPRPGPVGNLSVRSEERRGGIGGARTW